MALTQTDHSYIYSGYSSECIKTESFTNVAFKKSRQLKECTVIQFAFLKGPLQEHLMMTVSVDEP